MLKPTHTEARSLTSVPLRQPINTNHIYSVSVSSVLLYCHVFLDICSATKYRDA